MTPEQARSRLEISLLAVSGWERDGVANLAEDAARVISSEVRQLNRIAAGHPELEPQAAAIAARYRDLLIRIRHSRLKAR